jgi:serine/threonine protein kinase/Tfp pilus assembly protein PilF
MGDADFTRAKEIFGEALERSGMDRAAFLAGACAGDAALRSRVEALLWAAERDDAFLRDATVGSSLGATAPIGEVPGQRIGPYRLLQQIGEGGFGAVFMAEQERPVRRRVALKIIKLGMDTKSVVARFEQERQALAVLDHPHIAKVLDAGATEAGRPYFVMELVKGEAITSYCDARSLTIRERLELFAQVCQAVQHAHTKGIIHRDIKPSNVLVSEVDGRASARVIDFGIAKATDHRLTEKTLFTDFQQVIGTPEYMSPEQAGGSLDIDTRTDVYSLGVLLYELVTGSTPFDGRALRSAAYGELQRIIREVEPPKPSTRISESGAKLGEVAARRRMEPRRLGTLVRGELDWIVMKAMEKDRSRRYETPGSLARDVGRYLEGEAVSAAPPTASYRVRKFVGRNRAAVVTGVLVFTALVVGVVGTSLGLVEAKAAREREAEAATRATRQAEIAEAANTFLNTMLARADRGEEGGNAEVTVREVLDAAAAELVERPGTTDPAVLASVHRTIGKTYEGLGLYEKGAYHLREALRLSKEVHGDKHAASARALRELASLLFLKDEPVEAESLARRALTLDLELGNAPGVAAAEDHAAIGLALGGQRKYAEGEKEFDQAVALLKAAPGDHRESVAEVLVNLALMVQQRGDSARAERIYREVLAVREELGKGETPKTASVLNNLAWAVAQQRRFKEAEELYVRTVALRRRLLGPDHPLLAMTINNYGGMLQASGEPGRAEPLMREALEIRRKSLGEESTFTIGSVENLASVLQDLGRLDEAEELYTRSLALRRKVLGDGSADVADSLGNMGSLLMTRGRMAEAEPLFREALAIRRKVTPGAHPDTTVALINLAVCLGRQEKFQESKALTKEMVGMEVALTGETHESVALARCNYGLLLVSTGDYEEAEDVLRKAIGVLKEKMGPTNVRTLAATAALGNALAEQTWGGGNGAVERSREGETLLRGVMEERRKTLKPGDLMLAVTASYLGSAVASVEALRETPDKARLDEAAELTKEGFDGLTKVQPTMKSRTAQARERCARVEEVLERADPGKGHAARAAAWRGDARVE